MPVIQTANIGVCVIINRSHFHCLSMEMVRGSGGCSLLSPA
jgi:hypothetical protein